MNQAIENYEIEISGALCLLIVLFVNTYVNFVPLANMFIGFYSFRVNGF